MSGKVFSMAIDKRKRKSLYHDRELIRATLRENGVDPEGSGSIGHATANELGAKLAEKSGVDQAYCAWVITNYFGQKRRQERDEWWRRSMSS